MGGSIDVVDGFIVAAGVGQLALVAGSLVIPRLLNWKTELRNLSTLMRRLFWVYAGYILATNLCFGLLSTFAPGWLTDETPLAAAVTGFIAVYWGARLIVQFACFRHFAPRGTIYRVGEEGLVTLFVSLTAVYGYAFALHLLNVPA